MAMHHIGPKNKTGMGRCQVQNVLLDIKAGSVESLLVFMFMSELCILAKRNMRVVLVQLQLSSFV